MIVLSIVAVLTDPFLVVTAILLLVTVTIRQVMIVYENVSLTRDLEAKVASRTAQLTTLGFDRHLLSDAIVGISMDNRITAWNRRPSGSTVTRLGGGRQSTGLPHARRH